MTEAQYWTFLDRFRNILDNMNYNTESIILDIGISENIIIGDLSGKLNNVRDNIKSVLYQPIIETQSLITNVGLDLANTKSFLTNRINYNIDISNSGFDNVRTDIGTLWKHIENEINDSNSLIIGYLMDNLNQSNSVFDTIMSYLSESFINLTKSALDNLTGLTNGLAGQFNSVMSQMDINQTNTIAVVKGEVTQMTEHFSTLQEDVIKFMGDLWEDIKGDFGGVFRIDDDTVDLFISFMDNIDRILKRKANERR